eukprot:GHVU01069946.1.p1 GENE.GHVU01069946.1~~GHVU01069946.1.p1  ORF type:complete len:240 (-),score=37.28 GHVU01069946.1:497-1216(-)
MKSRTIAILLLAIGAGCQLIKGEAAAAANSKAELDALRSEKATVQEEHTEAASAPEYADMVATSETKDKIPEVNVPIAEADSNEEYSSPSGDKRMMFEVEEANAEECGLEEGADKRSTLCKGDNLRRVRGPAYYRVPHVAYYPRRPYYAPGPYVYVPRRMEEGHDGEEEDSHDHQPRPRSPPPRPSMAPKLRREGNDWVVLFPEMVKHGDHYDVVYNKVTIFKVYDHYLRKYTYACGGH